ncbi:MAG: S9 family peptidase [Pseudomonadota bacterium]
MQKYFLGLVVCFASLTAPLWAQGSDEGIKETAARYGVRPSVLDISLSPSGTKIAWIAPGAEHTEVLNVYDMNGTDGIEAIITNTEQAGDLSYCDWVTDTRLLCGVAGMGKRSDDVLIPFSRMFAINADGSDVKVITKRKSLRALRFNQDGGRVIALDVAGMPGEVLLTRNYIKDRSTGTRLANSTKEGLGVDRVDIENARRRSVEAPDPFASYYLADETGVVRFKSRSLVDSLGRLTGERVYLYRPQGEDGWKKLSSTLDDEELLGFRPIAVSAGANALYGYRSINGYGAVVEVLLDGSGGINTVAARDDVDADGLLRIGRQRRVVGAAFATEKRSVEYFDPELAKLSKKLSKALPNQPLISIASASADEKRLIIIASSDTDPGLVYLYDKEQGTLNQLLAIREYLVDQPMGTMTPMSYPAVDNAEIPGFLTLPPGSDGKNLPAIVLPHGGPAARDYWGFDWLVQFLTARGYAVLQPNYRGSSGYGEAWFGRNGYQSWDVAVGDIADAGRWLVSEGIADPDKLAIMGWSYGGYAALQSQVVDADLFKAVVAIAPVTDLEFLRDDARAYTSFRVRDEQLGEGPHIAAGSPRRHAEDFKAPVALFHGTLDINVEVRHSRAMADALEDAGKPVVYSEYEGLQHDLDDSKVRAEMLEKIDTFLSSALGS